jgi:hypothetical protein
MRVNKKIRAAFSSLPSYCESPIWAYRKLEEIAESLSLKLGAIVGFFNEDGHFLIDVSHEDKTVGYVYFSWYHMPSGRFEIVSYLS